MLLNMVSVIESGFREIAFILCANFFSSLINSCEIQFSLIVIATRLIADFESNGIAHVFYSILYRSKIISESIHHAISTNDVIKLKKLLSNSYSRLLIDARDESNRTPLMRACFLGQLECVQILVERGASLKLCDSYGTSVLMFACDGYPEIIHYLVKHGVNVNDRDIFGGTSLMLASYKGHDRCVRVLVDLGADANKLDKYGRNALKFATIRGHHDVVDVLLMSGCSPDTPDSHGNSCLIIASTKGYEECVKVLLSYGANVNLRNHRQSSAIMFASFHGHESCFDLLIKTPGIEVNAKDVECGGSALLLAISHARASIVKKLLTFGVDTNVADNLGRTTLMFAALYFPACISSLVEHGADVDAKDNAGVTALMFAITQNSLESIVALIALKANLNLQDNNGTTALMLACYKGNQQVVNRLLEAGADPNTREKSGKTAVTIAATDNHHLCLQEILNGPTKVDLNTQDITFGGTALIISSLEGHVDTVRILVKHGAGVNIQDYNGRTALMMSCFRGHTEITEILLKRYANTDLTDFRYGMTALILASEAGHIGCVDLLLAHGADADVSDKEGGEAINYCKSPEIRESISAAPSSRGYLIK